MQVLNDIALAIALVAVLLFVWSWLSRERLKVRQAHARVVNLADERHRREALRQSSLKRLPRR